MFGVAVTELVPVSHTENCEEWRMLFRAIKRIADPGSNNAVQELLMDYKFYVGLEELNERLEAP